MPVTPTAKKKKSARIAKYEKEQAARPERKTDPLAGVLSKKNVAKYGIDILGDHDSKETKTDPKDQPIKIGIEDWFEKETTPVYRNINKWVAEKATPDAKIVKKK